VAGKGLLLFKKSPNEFTTVGTDDRDKEACSAEPVRYVVCEEGVDRFLDFFVEPLLAAGVRSSRGRPLH